MLKPTSINIRNKRVGYFDLAKGILMIFIIMIHMGGLGIMEYEIYPGFVWIVNLPAFFIISGYFFKPDESLIKFSAHKIYQLLIPYIVCLIPVFVYVTGWAFFQDSSFSYSYAHRSVHNDPSWFILSLFIIFFEYYFIRKIPTPYIQFVVVLLLALIGTYLPSIRDIKLLNSMQYLIYFWLGAKWRELKWDYIIFNKTLGTACLIIFAALAVFYSLTPEYEAFIKSSPLYFIGALSGTIVLLNICKYIDNIPLINYIGEASLVFLMFHQYILFFTGRGLHITNPWIMIIATLAILLPIAYITRRYFPWLIGRKVGRIKSDNPIGNVSQRISKTV